MKFGVERLQDLVERNSGGEEWTERVTLHMSFALNKLAGAAMRFLIIAFVKILVQRASGTTYGKISGRQSHC